MRQGTHIVRDETNGREVWRGDKPAAMSYAGRLNRETAPRHPDLLPSHPLNHRPRYLVWQAA